VYLQAVASHVCSRATGDNVVNYQVVLASGAIVDANQKSNSALCKALRWRQ
jgi:hypothetical protein